MEASDIFMEEKKLMGETRYRNYMSNIDKALKNFEYSSEWADLISALGKLSKAISGNTHYQIIPRRIKISKRLAQCMHPALPSGVHLKALETYAVIFSKTGPERLATELFIYSAGLFPLLGYAAMNVRPNLLGIYETYFVPLGEKLRPALSGFLSGVLPGYESGLDHFERTNSLLTQVCAAVSPMHFYTVLWECVATNASVRLPAITYLLEHFNKRLGMPDQTYVMGHNRDVMMSGLCACLNDTVILVQRNTLEFLLLGFPMHTKLLVETELVKLVTNALNTILRRDMSLNRRLYAWLLGTEVMKNSPTYEATPQISQSVNPFKCNDSNKQADSDSGRGNYNDVDAAPPSYFKTYSRHIVMQALIKTLKYSLECTPVDLKPYRIMISLLDKAEIGSAVLDFVLWDIIRTLSLSSSNVEVVKSANLLFATFDPAYIWSFMIDTFEKSCQKAADSKCKRLNIMQLQSEQLSNPKQNIVVGCGQPQLVEVCYLTEFLLETISLEMYNETTRIYLPKVFLAVTQMLTIHLDNLNDDDVMSALKLCMKIVSRVQPTITPVSRSSQLMQQKQQQQQQQQQRYGDRMHTHSKSQPLYINLSEGWSSGSIGTEHSNNMNNSNNLEKSKSDSKLDQFAQNQEQQQQQSNLLILQTSPPYNSNNNKCEDKIKRSNSNQHMERGSPTKKKKAKSYSKLSELDKEICPDTGQVINPRQSSSDLDTPTSIKKIKSKTKQPRLRMSPKKLRPLELHISRSDSNTKLQQQLLLTPDDEFSEESPKSAPVQQQQQQAPQLQPNECSPSHKDSLIFQYQNNERIHKNGENNVGNEEGTRDNNTNCAIDSTGCSILEKCIRQYEIFFEVYVSMKVLHITSLDTVPTKGSNKANEKNDEVAHEEKINNDNASYIFNMNNFFQQEEIYEHNSPQRFMEIDNLFTTLCVLVVNRSKQLRSLLNRSLLVNVTSNKCYSSSSSLGNINHANNGVDDSDSNSEIDHDPYVDIDDNTMNRLQTLFTLRLNASLRNPIKLAINLLVEMSTFPNCNKSITLDRTEKELPSWLKVLCLVACYTQSDKELQITAITILFDLISLLKSQIEHTTSPGVTFVVMLPLLKFGHVYYIERHTRIFQLLISTLWDYLGEKDVDASQICALLYQLHNCLESGLVERIIDNRMYANAMQQHIMATAYETLHHHHHHHYNHYDEQRSKHQQNSAALNFYRRDRATDIHMMYVVPYHMMKPVMLERLNESESRSFRKFELLWHLGRDKQQARDFEKLQFKVMDTLALPPQRSLRTHVTKWLQSSLLRGDLSRLVKPLYKILLNKDTTRVGIVHLYAFQHKGNTNNPNQRYHDHRRNISNDKRNDMSCESSAADAETSLEQDVYAISSEYGNIRYHKDLTLSGKKRSPIRTFHKKIFGVALSSKNKTANFVSDEITSSPASADAVTIASTNGSDALCSASTTTIGLIINPLDNSLDFDNEDLDNDLDNSQSNRTIGQSSLRTALKNNLNEVETEAEALECDISDDDIDNEDEAEVEANEEEYAAYNDIDEEEEEGCTDAVVTAFMDRDYTDDSESSIFDSESENRDTTSAEKEPSSQLPNSLKTSYDTLNLKRYVGHCESVTELLSQHERTKNRKTYHLTREKTLSRSNMNSYNTEETLPQSKPVIHLDGEVDEEEDEIEEEEEEEDDVEDIVHPADEYFDMKIDEHQVESSVNALLEQPSKRKIIPDVVKKCSKNRNKSKSQGMQRRDGTKNGSGEEQQQQLHEQPLLTQHRNKNKNKNNRKRSSCISKTSTDSNNSYNSQGPIKNTDDRNDLESDSNNMDELIINTSQNASNATLKTINADGIQYQSNRQSSTTLGNNSNNNKVKIKVSQKSKENPHWELTAQALEKSKENLKILRQNVASTNLKMPCKTSAAGTAAPSATIIAADSYLHKNNNSNIGYNNIYGEHFIEGKERLLMTVYQNHMLIYLNVYDTIQTLYAFQTLRNIIECDTRTFLCLSITTSLSSGSLKRLLTRHRKSIAGKGFSGNISSTEFAQSYRGCMHLEVLLLLCLFYARSFFHVDSRDNAGQSPTKADVLGNSRVQLESIELLTVICNELIEIVKGMGKGLACYLADLMGRCKLQKVILHCLNFSVNTYGHTYEGATIDEKIVNFNNPQDDNLLAEALQLQLLRLLMVVIKLESEVFMLKNEMLPLSVMTGNADPGAGTNSNGSINITDKDDSNNISPTRYPSVAGTEGDTTTATTPATTEMTTTVLTVKYLPNCLISQQPMFLSAILSALQDERLRHLHHNWTELVTASLNCFNFGALTNIVISVIHQLCNNIDQLVKMGTKEKISLPPDYVISQLEAVTVLCHYCLLETSQQTTLSQLFNQAYPQTSSTTTSQHSQTGQLFNSIVHSLLPNVPGAMNSSTNQSDLATSKNVQLMAARNAVLSHLPRIVSSVAAVWDSDLGQIRQIKQQLMEFLSPISLHHGVNFLTAIAVTWQERGEQYRMKSQQEFHNLSIEKQYQKNSGPQASTDQLRLVALVSSIRVMPMDSFVQTLHQVIKSPPPIHKPPAYLKIEVSALELFYFYMKSAPAPQLADSWPSLLALLRDGLTLIPPAQFILLMLLNEFVQRCPQMPFQDKKDIRDLHDVTSRLVDSLSNVAGSCLEQTTWLRRNLAVKEDIALPITVGSTTTNGNSNGATIVQQYSVQAQSVLAALLANLLDVAYGSQEKDKVVSIVTTLLYNITPYLRNHTTRNIPSFYACSNLLASLSGYQYTRKAWRKDMMDLLLDGAFFQMDISCLPFWKQIMDSLMTYDNTTFRELMSRVSLTQSGSLNIFTSREQEYEQRSMLLKRLAFVIFCSEFDQYHKYMPEIQEQLANSLRLFAMVPCVQASVFLCFRVLLLRMSPDHVTSMWPIIIAEMVQVFLCIEQELKVDGEDLSYHLRMVTGSDGAWPATANTNSLTLQTQTSYWRAVQLEASKLLEMGCCLPATLLPHFQMYRWAFIGTQDIDNCSSALDSNINNNNNNKSGKEHSIINGVTTTLNEVIAAIPKTSTAATNSTMGYEPHIRRIAKLMDMKYTVHTPTINHRRGKHLMLTFQQINSLQDLYGFFSTINVAYPNPNNYSDVEHDVQQCLQEIEQILSADFLEKMSSTTTTPR